MRNDHLFVHAFPYPAASRTMNPTTPPTSDQHASNAAPECAAWSPDSWQTRTVAHAVEYPNDEALSAAMTDLRAFPPLVTSWEIERLRSHLVDAEAGKRFLLQGGDCAELLTECRPEPITNKLKILLQMSLVLVHGVKKPIIRVGRFAGQYAKPRSSPMEPGTLPSGEQAELPSYFGDAVNGAAFTPESRIPDPQRLVQAYQHSAMTLNFIRSLLDGGFADMHHPEYWDLSFFEHADLSPQRRDEYRRISQSLAEALEFMEAIGEARVDELTRVEFFTSHEGLNLHYEAAQTRLVPRRPHHYNLSTHLPWIGERTRALDGAHIEYFRGIANPVGVKVGPKADPDEVVELTRVLNPANEPGKLVLIARMGAANVAQSLPPIVEAVAAADRRCLWISDPMHGNGIVTQSGVKTRAFNSIASELTGAIDVFDALGTTRREGEEQPVAHLGGVHFELTGDDVTECTGGASGVTEEALGVRYDSLCDPRLNYQQSLELALILARRLSAH